MSNSYFQIGAVSFAGHHLFEILISVLLNFGITPEIENLVCPSIVPLHIICYISIICVVSMVHKHHEKPNLCKLLVILQVYYFVAIGIILLGAGFGYWLLRKFLFSQDGGLLVSAAQFVKWSMFSVAVTCIFLVGHFVHYLSLHILKKVVYDLWVSYIYLISSSYVFSYLFQSPKDNLMAMAAVGSCLALYHVIAKTKWCYHE